ncbi:phytoene synthase [Sphingomonas sp. SRS2]|nr:phytoene synthase [Sphingomonas sp. SRS2]
MQIERAALVEIAEATINRGSQSFAMASKLFGREARERAWLLYAWCRTCDDMVDGQTLGHGMETAYDAPARLESLRAQTDVALTGDGVVDPAFAGLRHVASECRIPSRLIHDHIAGFAADAAGWRPKTEDDLLSYCYFVAGAVGCMMALVMGVEPDDEDTLDRACDLGIAFQLSNIARDIREDAENGRCYIPATWLDQAGLEEADLVADHAASQLAAVAARLVTMADRHERSARIGAARLPFRCRWAILSAAGIYGDIGHEVVRRGDRAWRERVAVPGMRKAGFAVRALGASLMPTPRTVSREGLWTRPR